VRETETVFDATQQQSVSVGKPRHAGVEDAVHRIRPVFSGQDGIVRVAEEKRTLPE
jgi:hypothetical protein